MALSILNPTFVTGYNQAYGGIPSVPSPTSTAAEAVGGNLANLPGLTGLAEQVNKFNIGQAAQPYIMGLPNYEQMVGQSSKNIGSLLAGQIPTDVLSQMSQAAAERGINIGSAGSDNVNAALMRALGLTSLDLMGRGETELTGAMARTPTAKLFDPSSMFVTPEQQQAAQMAANIYASAPIPQYAANEAINAARRGAQNAPGFPTQTTPIQTPTTARMSPTTFPTAAPTATATTGATPGYGRLEMSGLDMSEPVGEDSSTWNILASYGIDPSGWNREDAAYVLGIDPQDLDVGSPAVDPYGEGILGQDEYYGDVWGGSSTPADDAAWTQFEQDFWAEYGG